MNCEIMAKKCERNILYLESKNLVDIWHVFSLSGDSNCFYPGVRGENSSKIFLERAQTPRDHDPAN